MATYQTFQAVGEREDLIDVIYDISPTDTPFMSTVAKTSASNVYHEWQTDSLAAAATNAAVEGADASDATLSATTRVGNYTQISQKTIKISGTLESVDKAGRKSEKAYQLAKASKEIPPVFFMFTLEPQAFIPIPPVTVSNFMAEFKPKS